MASEKLRIVQCFRSPVGGIILGHTRALVRPRDAAARAEALSERLGRPLGNPDALVRHIRQRFAIETMAEETMAVYQGAFAGSGRKADRGAPFAKAAGKQSMQLPARRRVDHAEKS